MRRRECDSEQFDADADAASGWDADAATDAGALSHHPRSHFRMQMQ